VIVYTFILRFFVRAVLCYINLIRWNVLQAACVELKLVRRTGDTSPTAAMEQKLRDNIQHYYFEWLSPLRRRSQLFENLKLGFYLLFALSLFFVAWGATALWHNPLVKGLTAFAVLNTTLEAYDFLTSSFFDDVASAKRRGRDLGRHQIFPIPSSRGAFLAGWILNLVISVVIATWPSAKVVLLRLWCS
jgi:hypothetical protein